MVWYRKVIVEFLLANLKRKDFLDEENLRLAFNFFDENHDGQISVSELRRVFTGIKGDVVLKEIIGETDTDNDGQVHFPH